MARNIKPRSEDYAQWYLDVIKAGELADHSPVRGCMVIRPEGFAVWEAIQKDLDARFKETGHVNAYFPLLIPQSFLTKEAQHVEGFAMECAIVTHSKLEKSGDGTLRPAGALEEPLIVRPTSETVIGHMYSQWVQSYRDLPVLINQWANVMRWEMRTRLFLRTSEFLWQEGHTAHETAEEAQEETLRMLDVYASFAEESLALPVVKGRKTPFERFPGAEETYTIEGLMQDGKALQCGTSHNLGQNFSRAFDIDYLGRDNKQHLAWTTSWGVSTRLIGALIMAHSDDEGLVLPPKVAPIVLSVIPIFRKDEDKAQVAAAIDALMSQLVGEGEVAAGEKRLSPGGLKTYFFDKSTHQKIVVDWRSVRPGDKQYHWEQRGVPFRIEVGPRDVEKQTFVLKRRVDREKEFLPFAAATPDWLRGILDVAQAELLTRARTFRDGSTRRVKSYDEMKEVLKEEGGFVRCHFKPDRAREQQVKDETKATVRCIPFEQEAGGGKCILSGEDCDEEVIFAQAY
ncbi:MAG: His/Gly/Thr/Pro-type tRNA ligase C-terminal domain-containing protein [Planctomycetota bacterium]|jgi:prolyl-tRNA synthetase|nr:His/Gly/Thr/Pro-type tRNA ligase C-terminal domain-containing protein [Planctomycetota bacterium]